MIPLGGLGEVGKNMTVFEIAELDLSYAPPYAPVWDPLLIAANQAIKEE